MITPTNKVLSILNRELKLAKQSETKAVLSEITLIIEKNIVPFENKTMADVFDSGFSIGCDYALNDKGNVSGKDWVQKNTSDKIIMCEICDSEVIPNCEYDNCPNK